MTNRLLGVLLALFVLWQVNYPSLRPESALAIFAGAGLVLCFRNRPLSRNRTAPWIDRTLVLAAAGCCAFVVVQSEPVFEALWIAGESLGNRAGRESALDVVVGACGLLLVLEAARRAVGWALPVLSTAFLAYAAAGPLLPSWLLPHRGYGLERIVSQTFLHSQGVFGTALRVMFVYVFLFVVFGAVLEQTGATRFIIDFARRLFRGSRGGPAKVSVLSSGLMGSLSGSAVANTATTGTFTIPLMRDAGFDAETAGGIEAAASSGGALVPPVMGAGAYMMLEIIEPPVRYIEIVRAALIPALLYYLALFLIVHLHARRLPPPEGGHPSPAAAFFRFEGVLFVGGIAGLVAMLLAGFTVFRAATAALVLVLVAAAAHPRTRLAPTRLAQTLSRAATDAVPLICAAACVGIVIGVVTLTGVGTRLPATVLSLAEGSLAPALVLLMVSSIVLGMGMPSAVCYLLLATLVGPALGDLGVVPLAAHLFIFYFGMMSMVTPPVALAAYTAASIAGGPIMRTGFAAFRFALVGFTLPYMFVYHPALLMLDSSGATARLGAVAGAVMLAVAGIVALAAGISGWLVNAMGPLARGLSLAAAALMLAPSVGGLPLYALGVGLLVAVVAGNALNRAPWRRAS